jgi:hypothetical protein
MEATTTAPELELTKLRGVGLTGEDLQALLQRPENQDADETALMRAAGYFVDTLNADGELVRTAYRTKEFYAAFAASFGVKIKKPARSTAGSPKGARSSVKVAINTKKITIVGFYSEQAGFNEGDRVAIHAEPGTITVTLLEKASPVEAKAPARAQAELDIDEDELLDYEEFSLEADD